MRCIYRSREDRHFQGIGRGDRQTASVPLGCVEAGRRRFFDAPPWRGLPIKVPCIDSENPFP